MRTLLFLSLLAALVPGQAARYSEHDYSNRISLTDVRSIASFESEDLDGFTGGEKVSVSLDGAMLVMPDEDAPSLRTVRKVFSKAEDLSEFPVAEFSIFTHEGPAIEQFVTMTLSSGKRQFRATAQIIPTLWRTVIFDLSECPFLSRVESIEIGLECPSDKPWVDGRAFFIDDLRFGKALDLGFMLPSSTYGFTTSQTSKIKWKKDALDLRFKGGAKIQSPDLNGSRNSMFNPPLEDRNTFFVVMENRSDVSRVCLSWETLDGREARSLTLNHIARCGRIISMSLMFPRRKAR